MSPLLRAAAAARRGLLSRTPSLAATATTTMLGRRTMPSISFGYASPGMGMGILDFTAIIAVFGMSIVMNEKINRIKEETEKLRDSNNEILALLKKDGTRGPGQ